MRKMEVITGDGNGNITLGCTSVADYIKLSSYKVNSGSGSVNIADGQTLYAEGSGRPISGNNTDVPNGATLHPLEYVLSLDDAADNSAAIIAANDDWTNWEETRNVILYGRTLYKDGAWNTTSTSAPTTRSTTRPPRASM